MIPVTGQEGSFAKRYPLNILVVDDSSVNRLVAKALLQKKLGYKIKSAASGEKAINLCCQTSFDLVLMDLYMGYENGYDTARAILSNTPEGTTQPHIYAYSSGNKEECLPECLGSGIRGFILKPQRPEFFKSFLQEFYEHRVQP
tara:strand:- start:947 stop:1378 length:432 start_codon:yes stop_codon:yes gene_type:complete